MENVHPIRSRFDSVLGALLLFACGCAFAFDGCTYGLEPADPVSGRPKGCYTRIEHWVGVKQETWIRPLEQATAAFAIVGALVMIVRRSRR